MTMNQNLTPNNEHLDAAKLIKRERILNAGVDINDFRPVTFNELIKNFNQGIL